MSNQIFQERSNIGLIIRIIALLVIVLTFTSLSFLVNQLIIVEELKVLGINDQDCGRLDYDSNNFIDVIDLANISAKLNDGCNTPVFTWGCGNVDFNLDGNITTLDLNNLLSKYKNSAGCFIGSQFYASPIGLPTGTGTLTNPWDIQTAFNSQSLITPGSTLWLRGGTYGTGSNTTYTATLDGTISLPIVIANYPGEKAKIDGGISLPTDSSYIWLYGFEITNSTTNRTIDNISTFRMFGANSRSLGTKFINLYINNTGHPGIGFWEQIQDGGEVNGNIIWGTGVFDNVVGSGFNGGPRGAAIYGQNVVGKRLINNNIMFSNFTNGISLHGVEGAGNGYIIERNSVFNHLQTDSIIYSANDTTYDYVLRNNTFYKPKYSSQSSDVYFGLQGSNENAIVNDNFFYDTIFIDRWQSITLARNKIFSRNEFIRTKEPISYIEYDSNTYYQGGGSLLDLNTIKYSDKINLTSYTLDSNLTYSRFAPILNQYYVKPSNYVFGRAHVTAYNFEKRQTISIDPYSFLAYGDRYIVRDVLNYNNPILTKDYLGGVLELPTNLYEYALPVGNHNLALGNTAPEYLNYLVERVPKTTPLQVEAPKMVSHIKTFTTTSTQISLITNTSGSSIYYTTNNTEPSESSILYTAPITLTNDTIIKTFAIKSGFVPSAKVKFEIFKIDLLTGLAGEYTFEESSNSTIADNTAISAILPDGTFNGIINRVSGVIGNAVEFTGSGNSSYISIGNGYNSTSNFTVSFLGKVNKNSPIGIFVRNGGSAWNGVNYSIGYTPGSPNGTISFTTGSQNGGPIFGANSNNCQNVFEWNFYTVTFSQSALKLYCNGNLMSTTENIGNYLAGQGSLLVFGRSGSTNDTYIQGFLDEVRIYHNRTLTDAEIESLFNLYKNNL